MGGAGSERREGRREEQRVWKEAGEGRGGEEQGPGEGAEGILSQRCRRLMMGARRGCQGVLQTG